MRIKGNRKTWGGIFLVLVLFIPAIGFAANVSVFPGLQAVWDRASDANPMAVLGGAIVGVFVHEGFHLLALKAAGVEFKVDDLTIQYLAKKGNYWMDMAGFGGELLVGAALPDHWDFTLGYRAGSLIRIATYPLRYGWDYGDFSGGKKWEYGICALVASMEILKVEW